MMLYALILTPMYFVHASTSASSITKEFHTLDQRSLNILVDRFVDRVQKAGPLHRTDLDKTTLAKTPQTTPPPSVLAKTETEAEQNWDEVKADAEKSWASANDMGTFIIFMTVALMPMAFWFFKRKNARGIDSPASKEALVGPSQEPVHTVSDSEAQTPQQKLLSKLMSPAKSEPSAFEEFTSSEKAAICEHLREKAATCEHLSTKAFQAFEKSNRTGEPKLVQAPFQAQLTASEKAANERAAIAKAAKEKADKEKAHIDAFMQHYHSSERIKLAR